VYPDSLFNLPEAHLSCALHHLKDVCLSLEDGINYIEGLLRSQLIAAIGKTVTADDLRSYMRYHDGKLFTRAYAGFRFVRLLCCGGHHIDSQILIPSILFCYRSAA
jgi:hypothetical protein